MSRRLALLAAVALGGLPLPAAELRPVPIPTAYDELWLLEVRDLLTPEEREGYLELDSDAARLAFRRGFWAARDEAPRSRTNELRQHFVHRMSRVRELGLAPEDLRSRTRLLLGNPDREISNGDCGRTPAGETFQIGCLVTPPFELLAYETEEPPNEKVILFVQHEGRCVLYHEELVPPFRYRTLPETMCRGYPEFPERLRRAMRQEIDLETILDAGLDAPPRYDWLEGLATEVREEVGPGSRMSVEVVDWTEAASANGEPEVLRGRVRVPVAASWHGSEAPWRNVSVFADLFANETRIDTFDHILLAPAAQSLLDIEIELALPPLLPPDAQLVLVVHAEDEAADLFLTNAFALDRERALGAPPALTSPEPPTDTPLARSITRYPWIEIEPLAGPLFGPRRIRLDGWSPTVHRVAFSVRGSVLAEAPEPPFDALVDFGPAPREAELEAVAFDDEGREIARDRVAVNLGVHHFGLELFDLTPPSGDRAVVRGRVHVPSTGTLDRVELFEGERRVEVVRESPFVYSRALTPAEQRGEAAMLRAVAHLTDGRHDEDWLLLSRSTNDEVDVDLVELFAGVVDRNGAPVVDLDRQLVTVYEDGRPQQLHEFRHLSELPIHVLLLLDTSSSMVEKIAEVRAAGLGFLEQVLRPDDRAALVSFSHRTYVVVPFTGDLDTLREGSRALRAWGGTRLYDSTALSLFYLQGLEGKRALVLVTDGVDEGSALDDRELLAYAERTGVAVYTLTLGSSTTDRRLAAQTKRHLQRLSRRTGGRFFAGSSIEELPEIYRKIESDLRSQYLITYESDAPPLSSEGESSKDGSEPGYRQIRVEVKLPGARVVARPGYYP